MRFGPLFCGPDGSADADMRHLLPAGRIPWELKFAPNSHDHPVTDKSSRAAPREQSTSKPFLVWPEQPLPITMMTIA